MISTSESSVKWAIAVLAAAILALGLGLPVHAHAAAAAETETFHSVFSPSDDWKGAPPQDRFQLGASLGLGVYDGSAGFAFLVNGALPVAEEGLIPDVADRLLLEAYVGPTWLTQGTAWNFGVHARWDFQRNEDWAFYGLGGLGASATGESLDSSWRLSPRFGVGAFWAISPETRLRAELSHDLITVGGSYGF